MSTATSNDNFYIEHLTWLEFLKNAKNNLKELQTNLEDSVSSLKSKSLLARVEQFQNRLIRQREVIDELRHDIKQHENKLETKQLDKSSLQYEHNLLRDNYVTFFDLFVELERDFDEFMA